MSLFGPKPWVNPVRKMSIFRLFELLVFIAQKSIFFVLEYRKRHVPGLYCLKKNKLEKQQFLDQNGGLTPLEKCQFFDFVNFLFLQPKKAFFLVIEYRKRHFNGLYCLKEKVLKMAIFGPKPWVNPLRKMSIFRLFELLVFIAQKGSFSFQNIVKDIFLVYIDCKKKVAKMAIFGPKPTVNPIRKMSIFRFFELLLFIAQKGIFSFYNIVKDIFLVYIT